MSKEYNRLKWGIGRMFLDSPVTPIIVPIWHVGMDDVLTNDPPYIFKTSKKVTFKFGEPTELSSLLAELMMSILSEKTARKAIADKIQEELLNLKEKLHKTYLSSLHKGGPKCQE